jgi:hypothetical protein
VFWNGIREREWKDVRIRDFVKRFTEEFLALVTVVSVPYIDPTTCAEEFDAEI